MAISAFIFISLFFNYSFSEQNDFSALNFKKKYPSYEHFGLSPVDFEGENFENLKRQGQVHAQIYPVTVTGVLPPIMPIKRILDHEFQNPIKNYFLKIFANISKIQSFKDLLLWLGLNEYPKPSDTDVYQVARPNHYNPYYPMGFGELERGGATGFTFSCATCHSSSLFGKTILGMSNRFPRANEFFIQAKKGLFFIQKNAFQQYSLANDFEMNLLMQAKENVKSINLKKPLILGLDTSLSQVALSLSKRNPDAVASKNSYFEKFPRNNLLDSFPSDSKPAVWWNVKYKNKWLSDGSVISGNPIYTNILWNEIGRGTDLLDLEKWLKLNSQVIKELSVAVLASEPPAITDFFAEEKIDLSSAKRGESLFVENCSSCHGQYKKNWSLPEFQSRSLSEQIKTFQVIYKKETVVKDVGTDSHRYKGMQALEVLNNLKISKDNGIVIKSQNGYVPPPLVGIWARWPYMHNNSIPNLCQLLTPANERVKFFYQGPAIDKNNDFDFDCNGYPLKEKTPKKWTINHDNLYDTRKAGMGNMGHDENIFLDANGDAIFTEQDKKDLIHFLQTL